MPNPAILIALFFGASYQCSFEYGDRCDGYSCNYNSDCASGQCWFDSLAYPMYGYCEGYDELSWWEIFLITLACLFCVLMILSACIKQKKKKQAQLARNKRALEDYQLSFNRQPLVGDSTVIIAEVKTDQQAPNYYNPNPQYQPQNTYGQPVNYESN